jgi:hypothetical protein
MPTIDYLSNAPPSIFAYPPALVDKKEEKKKKVETAVLSITAIQKKRDHEKKNEDIISMEIVRYSFKVIFIYLLILGNNFSHD